MIGPLITTALSSTKSSSEKNRCASARSVTATVT
jgi:hypothetical protein